jgi:hypothetical protein
MNPSRLGTATPCFSLLWVTLLGIWFASAAHSAPVDEARQEFPKKIVFEGTARERGQAYGERYRTEIREFLDHEIYGAFVGQPASKSELLAYAAACRQVVRDECPIAAEEFHGIATGAGLTFDEVTLINLHEELYHRTGLPHGHCTAVAVAPPDTGNNRTYVGQTWDWMESVAGKSRVSEWRRTDGVSVLAYGYPGMPIGAGVNSAGIALCWTSAALGTDSQTPRIGVPSYILIAEILAQRDLDSVIRLVEKNKHAGWFTFVIADGEGNLLNIEGSPDRVVVERHDERFARVLYGSAEMTATSPGQRGPLHARCQTMYDLLEKSAGKNDLACLQDYFSDPVHSINMGPATIDMMVFDTTARRAYLSRGSSYKLGWREFGFGVQK